LGRIESAMTAWWWGQSLKQQLGKKERTGTDGRFLVCWGGTQRRAGTERNEPGRGWGGGGGGDDKTGKRRNGNKGGGPGRGTKRKNKTRSSNKTRGKKSNVER